jgi:hypothetical protein
LKFLIPFSFVPFASEVKPGSCDPWYGFPAEREEIFDFNLADERKSFGT